MTCRKFESCYFHLYNKKNLNGLKINNLYWIYQKTDMAGQTSTPRSADSQIQGDTAKLCLIAAEAMIW